VFAGGSSARQRPGDRGQELSPTRTLLTRFAYHPPGCQALAFDVRKIRERLLAEEFAINIDSVRIVPLVFSLSAKKAKAGSRRGPWQELL
jgi:hypothetical protein